MYHCMRKLKGLTRTQPMTPGLTIDATRRSVNASTPLICLKVPIKGDSLNSGSTRSIPRTTLSPMAMGKRRRHAKQTSMWVATQDLPRSAAHPFYTRLNQILDKHDFDGCVEVYVSNSTPRRLAVRACHQDATFGCC